MHILLTDILTCPRCGPEFGLILRADRMIERRVIEGAVGCPNCRETYPIRDATVHFAPLAADKAESAGTAGADDAGESSPPDPDDAEAALRLAALMGVTQGPAYVLLAGSSMATAARIAAIIERVEVITVAPPDSVAGYTQGSADATPAAVSRLVVASKLPLATARLSAVVLSGPPADLLLEEAARTMSPLGRLVLEAAPPDSTERLAAAGLRVLAQDADTIVAVDRRIGG